MNWRPDPNAEPEYRPEPTVEEMLAQIERLDHNYDLMAKVWAQIQDNLRHPWRQK